MYYDCYKLKDEIKEGDILQNRYLITDIATVDRIPYFVTVNIFDLHTCKHTLILLNELEDFIKKRYKKTHLVLVKNCQDIAYIDYV